MIHQLSHIIKIRTVYWQMMIYRISKNLFADHAHFSVDMFSHDLKIKDKVQLFIKIVKTLSFKQTLIELFSVFL